MSNSAVGNSTNGCSAGGGGDGAGGLNPAASSLPAPSIAAEGRMNLAALQQKDPYITGIVDTAKQVALYLFSSTENEWERTAIEGTLFVYRRSALPDNGFMILNRLGPNNLIEPITKDLEFQLHDPFLLYRTAKAICGIWFYDKDECARVGQLMNSLVQLAITNHHTKSQNCTRQRRASESDTLDDRSSEVKNEASAAVAIAAAPPPLISNSGSMSGTRPVGIMQLLTKAQHEYDKSKDVRKKPEPVLITDNPSKATASVASLIRPTPVCVSTSIKDTGTAEVLGNFGAGAGPGATGREVSSHICLENLFYNNGIGKNISNAANQSPISNISRSLPGRESEISSNQLPAILKQLGSTVPMVEDIERQQRGELLTSGLQASMTSPNMDVSAGLDMLRTICQSQTMGSSLTTSNILSQGANLQQSHLVPTPTGLSLTSASASSDQCFAMPQSPKVGIPGFGHMNANGPRNLLMHDLTSSLFSPTRNNTSNNIGIEGNRSSNLMANLLVAGLDGSANTNLTHPPSPAAATKTGSQSLLTPADLETVRSTNASVPNLSAIIPPNLDILLSPMAFVSPQARTTSMSTSSYNSNDAAEASGDSAAISLTKEQLQQALVFLLKNDPNFLAKIHEAYLMSLNAEISNS